MSEPSEHEAPYAQPFWKLKSTIEKIPGAFRLYKFITSRTGEGKIYTVSKGPVSGLRWKRYNRLPYWYHLGLYEPQLTHYLQRHLRPNDTYWDLGAHAGYHAICAARIVGPQGCVIAVEPDPEIAAIMHEQIDLNELPNIIVLPEAVSDTVGAVTFMRSDLDSRTSAIAGIGGERGTAAPLEVPTTTIDTLSEQYPAPHILKMDIEGAEIFALPGGERLLSSSNKPEHLLIGVHGEHALRFTTEFVQDHGYKLISVPGFEPEVNLVAVRRAA